MESTQAGGKFYICATPKPTDLTEEQYAALTWVEVGKVGMIGETGTNHNIINYDMLSTTVSQKQKGIADAGDPTIEVSRSATDAGQIALRAAALTKYVYAFKIVKSDAPSDDYTNTILYNRGLVAGPTRPNGRNEDFDLEVYTLGLVQREIVVDPVAGSVPVVVLLPAISGLVEVGETLTAYVGTWTNEPTSYSYQWQHDASGNGTYANVATGGTSSTYIPVVGDVGDNIRVQVTATNGAGASSAASSAGSILAA